VVIELGKFSFDILRIFLNDFKCMILHINIISYVK